MRKIINTLGVAFFMFASINAFSQEVASIESNSNYNQDGIEYLEKPAYNYRVYPNPTSDILYVNSPDLVGKSFLVIDLTGKAVATQQVMNDNVLTIPVSSYPSGLYFLRFEDGTLIRFIVKR